MALSVPGLTNPHTPHTHILLTQHTKAHTLNLTISLTQTTHSITLLIFLKSSSSTAHKKPILLSLSLPSLQGDHRRVLSYLSEPLCCLRDEVVVKEGPNGVVLGGGGSLGGAWTREQFYRWTADYLRILWRR